MQTKSTILAIWTFAIVQYTTATQYAANLTRMPAQEYACDFYGSLWFEVKIPSNMSSSMYGNQLTMTLTLPRGTMFTDSKVKILWNNAQAQLLSLGSSDVPVINAIITLDKSVSKYVLSIMHNNSAICPFSIGQKSSIIRITSLYTTDMIIGQTSWNLEGHQVPKTVFYRDMITNYQTVLTVEFAMPCAFLPLNTNITLESTSTSDVISPIEAAGCQVRINDVSLKLQSKKCVTSGDKPALLLQDVNLRTIQKSDGTFTILFIGVKSHRFVGLSCHLTINFTAGGELYLSLPLCAENTLPKEWLSLNMNSTNMYVAKKNVPIKTILGVEVSLSETDSVLISAPDELVQDNPNLFAATNLDIYSDIRTSVGFSAINNTTVSITGLQVAEYSQLHITLLEINGTKTATAISQGLDFTAIDSLGRKIFHSVAPAFIFEPMAILIEAASFSKVPQFKKDIIDLDLTMSLEVLPSEDYSSLTLEFPIGFNLMPRITKIGGLTPNYGTRMSTPNILEIYSQQPYSKSLVIETKLNLLVRNIEIPQEIFKGNYLSVKLFANNRVGFSAVKIPIFDLGAHSLNLTSSSAAVEMLGNGNSSILLLTFTFEIDSSLPNNLVIEVILHDVVGYLSSDSQSIEIKANDEVWTACKAEIKIENNKKLIFVKSSDLAWSKLDAGKLVLWLRVGADNMVLPSYIVSDLTIKNDANRTLFQASNLSLNTGCDVGCTICFFNNKSSCVRCSEGFELLSNRCLIIVPKATLAELLGTNFLINRNTVSAICALGVFAVIFTRLFVSRLYWNIISTEIITKIVITNICNLAILARAISNTDEGKLTYMLWITFMNTNFIINLLMTCIFWMLAKPYPILRLDKKSSAALYLMYILSCLSSAANLLWLVSDRNVLDRLIKDKKNAEIKPTDVNPIVNDKNKLRSSIQKALDDKIVDKSSNTRVKRKSKSLNDMQLDVIEHKASLKDNQTDDLSTTATKGQEPHNLNNINAIPVNDSTSNNELPNLFDFLNMLRWLNFSLKATLLVAIVALSVFSEYRPWTKSPFDICIVISIELVFYGMCTVDKPESTEWRNKFELRARKIMIDDRKKTKGLKLNRSSPEEDQSHAIINLERNSMPETNNIPNLELPLGINQKSISPEDMPGHSNGLMDIKDSGISWHNMVNAIIDKGKSDDLDDFQDYDVDSMVHETDKDFKQFALENGFMFKKGFPVKLTRSTSLEKSPEAISSKQCIYVEYCVHRLEKRQEEIFLSSESEECEDIGEAGQDKPHVEMISNCPEVRIQVDDESREVEKIGDSEYGKY